MQDKKDPYLNKVPALNKNLEYITEDQIVKLVFSNNKKIQIILRKIGFKIPNTTTIDLDTYASFIFLQIDGKKTIYEIGEKAKFEFPDDVDYLYERLLTFLTYLHDKKWIYYK